MAETNLEINDEIVFDGLLSKDEFFKLARCASSEDELQRLTKWASGVLAQAELAKLLMEGWLVVTGWNAGEPLLAPNAEAREFTGAADLTAPVLEEMKCLIS